MQLRSTYMLSVVTAELFARMLFAAAIPRALNQLQSELAPTFGVCGKVSWECFFLYADR
jgi:hypothetical protein